ncbi:MAG: Gfo/Idh/MocA family oxidoreductase [Halobacteria archaeon]|nr:Gfo/Idh/MocA family oxidoreductase [Halobacteria archaeon]
MKFGIISTANIAQIALIPAIQESEHEIVAIGSREKEKAQGVAREFGIPQAYGSYEALLKDDNIDSIYNPLPNSLHAEYTKKAADEDLNILCEKPLALSAREAKEMGDYCEEKGITLMEAFMYRYHPRTERAAEIAENELEDIRSVKASFQFPLRGRPNDIRLNPDLGGGSLMDVGCYAVNAARLFLGEPQRVFGRTYDTRDCGVDTHLAGILEYEDGATAEVSSSFDTPNTQFYRVEATNGWLEVKESFVPPKDEKVSLQYSVDGRHVTEEFDPVNQYRLEVEHFVECVEKETQPRTDAEEAVKNMRVIDSLYKSAEDDKTTRLD